MSHAIQHAPKSSRIYPLITLLILVHLSTALYTLPLNRVVELRLCREHYVIHPSPDVPVNGGICFFLSLEKIFVDWDPGL